jgi:hypothetical protein
MRDDLGARAPAAEEDIRLSPRRVTPRGELPLRRSGLRALAHGSVRA